jgi:hypothetical protein
LRERGWRSPNSNEGTYTVVLYFVILSIILGIKKIAARRSWNGYVVTYG